MKLIEALEIVRKDVPEGAKAFRVSFACSFTPAHFQTLLHANLRLVIPGSHIVVSPGLYGDFWGNLARIAQENPDVAVLLM